MLQFEHVSLAYGSQQILHDLCFQIPDGQMTVLIGPSGCGKTTTLKMINRLIEPTSGKIYLDGEDIATKNKVDLRRHIGYVIQQIGLFPNMTVAQNICVVPTLLKYSKEECDRIARHLLEMVNLPYEQYAHKYPSEMSGGQQQRIGILRALAASPPIVLMDEPFSALDPMTRRSLQQEVRNLQQKLHKTIVFVTTARSYRWLPRRKCWPTRLPGRSRTFWASSFKPTPPTTSLPPTLCAPAFTPSPPTAASMSASAKCSATM